MLFHRGVFLDDRYRERKSRALKSDPRFRNTVSHRRDILPECVVNVVQFWFPYPKHAIHGISLAVTVMFGIFGMILYMG